MMNEKIDILDHGMIRLIDYMGGDLAISRSARVSYNAEAREDDKGLIKYLLMNGHSTPFESTCITFEVKSPIFVFRQWHRHRTQSYNELSARYKVLSEEFYIPEINKITMQSEDNKQMRTDEINPAAGVIRETIRMTNESAFKAYRGMLAQGCPRELARSVLPVGTYSHMFATANLFNWMRFMKERMHEHAQYEIRVYAEAICTVLEGIAPIAMKVFREKYNV